ncbi:Anti-sigma regulatory factor (Ser/Thr protein kinase) [Actinopolymorpha cephalotaxi]|uniref:Anti-sigma regulatory factor (Ser/Thr protein kinase) n=1 Tax=Actinopolymorpha cephalotaxi TaxID=504797 RepID=A0A1I2P6T4_9ACTN|nr:sensor histidine kinase [Actinopolymorpha cephalotaxi]NYH83728.1 hypothetical protein [Actinopolymorpha cephalotaxi]SFG11865.1 Anti-sigma regulatory factor (Ser/Thr protein kinase) [Actinopolymorpha cephalotaxi]
MSTWTPGTYAGNVHEVGFYQSDEEFQAMIVPFVDEGVANGEPVVIGYDEPKSALLRLWLDDPSKVNFITDTSLYATPARAIATYRGLFKRHVAAGAPQVRIAGQVPHPGNGGSFAGWDRYEFAVNSVWDEFPVRSLCLYDATTVPDPVRQVVERMHPCTVTAAGAHQTNGRYDCDARNARVPVSPDPLEACPPNVELVDPSTAEARHALERLGRGLVDDRKLDDLLFGISEAVTNARLHGVPPATVRIWATAERLVADVSDRGRGPTDPLAGLVPMANANLGTGLGLWIAHMLDIGALLVPTEDGFSFRLCAGRDRTPRGQEGT